MTHPHSSETLGSYAEISPGTREATSRALARVAALGVSVRGDESPWHATGNFRETHPEDVSTIEREILEAHAELLKAADEAGPDSMRGVFELAASVPLLDRFIEPDADRDSRVAATVELYDALTARDSQPMLFKRPHHAIAGGVTNSAPRLTRHDGLFLSGPLAVHLQMTVDVEQGDNLSSFNINVSELGYEPTPGDTPDQVVVVGEDAIGRHIEQSFAEKISVGEVINLLSALKSADVTLAECGVREDLQAHAQELLKREITDTTARSQKPRVAEAIDVFGRFGETALLDAVDGLKNRLASQLNFTLVGEQDFVGDKAFMATVERYLLLDKIDLRQEEQLTRTEKIDAIQDLLTRCHALGSKDLE